MRIEKYTDQVKRLPVKGKQIIAGLDGENIFVYQAYNKHIAAYAVANQQLGGTHYNLNRMSWIKPGFLWMMHRAGWATKENQECVLAITLPIQHFKTILSSATISSYDAALFSSQEEWKKEMEKTEVRLQWDPDHDPFGKKQERKAIQLGMKGETLKKFCTEWITSIEDITDFVKAEYMQLQKSGIDHLNVPVEDLLLLNDEKIETRIGISK